eukprot:13156-Heterococcus_DN1.PRE.1
MSCLVIVLKQYIRRQRWHVKISAPRWLVKHRLSIAVLNKTDASTATSAAATAAAVAIVTIAADLRLFCLVSIATAAVAAVSVMHLPLFKAAGELPLGKSEGDRMFVTTLNLKCCPRVTPSQVPPAAKSLPAGHRK